MDSDFDEYSDLIDHQSDSPDESEKIDVTELADEFHDARSYNDLENNKVNTFGDKNTNIFNYEETDNPVTKGEKEDAIRLEAESLLSESELEDRKLNATNLKDQGNLLFKQSDFDECLKLYTDALDICPLMFSIERAKIYSNRAACYSKLSSTKLALEDCDAALKLDPDYVRCLLRRADLRESSDMLKEALEDYTHVLKLDPSNVKSRAACALLPDKIAAQHEKLKKEMFGQLKQLGNMVLKPFGLSTDNFKVNQDPKTGGYSINFARN